MAMAARWNSRENKSKKYVNSKSYRYTCEFDDSEENDIGRLAHFGLVSQAIEDLGLVQLIDKLIDPGHPQQRASMGQRVSAMIMNFLAMENRTLYATSDRLEGLAMDLVMGSDVEANAFNDDALAQCLDCISEYGGERLFENVAMAMANKVGLGGKSLRLDSTSMHLYGAYQASQEDEVDGVRVTFGYSKDGRPDLKQVMLAMVTTGPANLPILAKPQDGNSSDKLEFVKFIEDFQKNFKMPEKPLWIADSALYSKNWLQSQGAGKDGATVNWLTRVPESIKLAKNLVENHTKEIKWVDLNGGYKACEYASNYGGVHQRWFLYYSEQAFKREKITLEKKIAKEAESLEKALWHLSNKDFSCAEDAQTACHNVFKKAKFHQLDSSKTTTKEVTKYAGRGRPKKDQKPKSIGYSVNGVLKPDADAISHHENKLGRFVLATNLTDHTQLTQGGTASSTSTNKPPMVPPGAPLDPTEKIAAVNGCSQERAESVLGAYKELQGTESGFKFLKDREFLINRFYVHKERRIESLIILMALSLFVWNYLANKMLNDLDAAKIKLPNPEGRPVKTNTLKRLVYIMRNILVVRRKGDDGDIYVVSKLKPVHRQILQALGPPYERKYGIYSK